MRKVHIEGEVWQYKVGKKHIVIKGSSPMQSAQQEILVLGELGRKLGSIPPGWLD